jgi:protein-S-isoprenylcysteine O-methyltransferase Ste14
MKQFVLAFGNFFFRWRDTLFSLIFVGAFASAGVAVLNPDGPSGDLWTSIVGLVIAIAGQFVRGITIGYAYIKRGGLNKQIFAETLQRQGVFAHSRNPMYLGNLLLVTGAMVTVNNIAFYAGALPLFYFIYYSIIKAEEEFLGKKFGAEYDQYKKEVNVLLPGNLSGWSETVKSMEFSFKRLIRKEHGSTFVIFAGLTLYNIAKFHLRYNIPLEDFTGLWATLGALTLFQITSAVLKRSGRLAEE